MAVDASRACILSIISLHILLLILGASSTDEVVKYCNSKLSDNQTKGICISFEKKLRNCPPLLKLLRERQFIELQKNFCDEPGPNFELSWVKVCCPMENYIESENENYHEHPNFKLLPTPDNSFCGQSANSDRIVGGEDALPGEFPFMARIFAVTKDDDSEQFICGGSIISKRYILSASHCFRDGVKVTKVRVGDTHGDTEVECVEFGNTTVCQKEEDYEAEDVIVNEGYTGGAGSQHDIALIRLKQDIRNISSLFIRPICLPFTNEFQILPLQIASPGYAIGGHVNAVVAGWGKLFNSDFEGSPDLQYLPVPVKDNNECGSIYRANNVTISELQICAGGERDKGSCAGDSGGPLFYPAKPKGKSTIRNFQIGIVSFGKSQCATTHPVVYSRVRKFLSWILDNIKE